MTCAWRWGIEWRCIRGRSLKKMARCRPASTNEEVPLPSDFMVRGIFDVKFPAYNRTHVVASLEDAARVLEMPEDRASGIKVKLRDEFQVDSVAAAMQGAVKEPVRLVTWREENARYFRRAGGGEEHDVHPAVFHHDRGGVWDCERQITFVVQKTREIGMLKALGATQRAGAVAVPEPERGGRPPGRRASGLGWACWPGLSQ